MLIIFVKNTNCLRILTHFNGVSIQTHTLTHIQIYIDLSQGPLKQKQPKRKRENK